MLDLQVNLAGDRAITTGNASYDGLADAPPETTASPVDRRWRDLLDLDAALQAERNIRLLTPEARVLLTLRLAGSLPISAAIEAAGTSHRGFYAVLDRLRAAGLVVTVKDPDDHRVRRLSLHTGVEFEG